MNDSYHEAGAVQIELCQSAVFILGTLLSLTVLLRQVVCSDGMIYRIKYRDSEVVSWHILVAIITPPKIDIPHNSNQ